MAQRYLFPQSGISSISVEGIEHKVDPDTGHLVVEVMTPGLPAELAARGATLISDVEKKPNPIAPQLTEAEVAERQELFEWLDEKTGTKTDRRRSLAQVRAMKADWEKAHPGE